MSAASKGKDGKGIDNLLFYTNRITSKPDGAFIEQILIQWRGKYDLLEKHHGYIQWLFPIREQGMNSQSSPLTEYERTAIIADRVAHARIIRAFRLMLDFYGIVLVSHSLEKRTAVYARSRNYLQRYNNLNTRSHNFLRITRILKCLGEFEYDYLQTPLCTHFLNEMGAGLLGNAYDACVDYWCPAIRSDAERTQTLNAANYVATVRTTKKFWAARVPVSVPVWDDAPVVSVPSVATSAVAVDSKSELRKSQSVTSDAKTKVGSDVKNDPTPPLKDRKDEKDRKDAAPAGIVVWSFVAPASQFTFGGESACPFGTIELATRVLTGELNPVPTATGTSDAAANRIVDDALRKAVAAYNSYFSGRAKSAHASPSEIMGSHSKLFPVVELRTWPGGVNSLPAAVRSLPIAMPDVLLPYGEMQLVGATDRHILQLLSGFRGGDVVLAIVNIGYVFGVHCRADTRYTVFDTHSKSLSAFTGRSHTGAYIATVATAEHALQVINAVPLASRAAVLSALGGGGGVAQAEAANNFDIAVLRLKSAAVPPPPPVAAAAAPPLKDGKDEKEGKRGDIVVQVYLNTIKSGINGRDEEYIKGTPKFAKHTAFERNPVLPIFHKFIDAGGRIIFHRDGASVQYHIPSGSRLYPVCLAGENRSQVMYRVMEDEIRRRDPTISVSRPHGAESGYDPWCARTVDEKNEYLFSGGAPWVVGEDDVAAFSQAFDANKQLPVGTEIAAQYPIAIKETGPAIKNRTIATTNRKIVSKWFDTNYFLPAIQERSDRMHIFVCFQGAASIIALRFTEVIAEVRKTSPNESLRHVLILSLPYGDPKGDAAKMYPKNTLAVAYANTYRDMYRLYATLLVAPKPVAAPPSAANSKPVVAPPSVAGPKPTPPVAASVAVARAPTAADDKFYDASPPQTVDVKSVQPQPSAAAAAAVASPAPAVLPKEGPDPIKWDYSRPIDWMVYIAWQVDLKSQEYVAMYNLLKRWTIASRVPVHVTKEWYIDVQTSPSVDYNLIFSTFMALYRALVQFHPNATLVPYDNPKGGVPMVPMLDMPIFYYRAVEPELYISRFIGPNPNPPRIEGEQEFYESDGRTRTNGFVKDHTSLIKGPFKNGVQMLQYDEEYFKDLPPRVKANPRSKPDPFKFNRPITNVDRKYSPVSGALRNRTDMCAITFRPTISEPGWKPTKFQVLFWLPRPYHEYNALVYPVFNSKKDANITLHLPSGIPGNVPIGVQVFEWRKSSTKQKCQYLVAEGQMTVRELVESATAGKGEVDVTGGNRHAITADRRRSTNIEDRVAQLALASLFGSDYPKDYEYELRGFLIPNTNFEDPLVSREYDAFMNPNVYKEYDMYGYEEYPRQHTIYSVGLGGVLDAYTMPENHKSDPSKQTFVLLKNGEMIDQLERRLLGSKSRGYPSLRTFENGVVVISVDGTVSGRPWEKFDAVIVWHVGTRVVRVIDSLALSNQRPAVDTNGRYVVLQSSYSLYVYDIVEQSLITIDGARMDGTRVVCGFIPGSSDLILALRRGTTTEVTLKLCQKVDNWKPTDEVGRTEARFRIMLTENYAVAADNHSDGSYRLNFMPYAANISKQSYIIVRAGESYGLSSRSFEDTSTVHGNSLIIPVYERRNEAGVDYLVMREFKLPTPTIKEEEWITGSKGDKRGMAVTGGKRSDGTEVVKRKADAPVTPADRMVTLALTALFGSDYPNDYESELRGFLIPNHPFMDAATFREFDVYEYRSYPAEGSLHKIGLGGVFDIYSISSDDDSETESIVLRKNGHTIGRFPRSLITVKSNGQMRISCFENDVAVLADYGHYSPDFVDIVVVWNIRTHAVQVIQKCDVFRPSQVDTSGRYVSLDAENGVTIFDTVDESLTIVNDAAVSYGFIPGTFDLLVDRQNDGDGLDLAVCRKVDNWTPTIEVIRTERYARVILTADFVVVSDEYIHTPDEGADTGYFPLYVIPCDLRTPKQSFMINRPESESTIARNHFVRGASSVGNTLILSVRGNLDETGEYYTTVLEFDLHPPKTDENDWVTGAPKDKRKITEPTTPADRTATLALTSLFGTDYPPDYASELQGFLVPYVQYINPTEFKQYNVTRGYVRTGTTPVCHANGVTEAYDRVYHQLTVKKSDGSTESYTLPMRTVAAWGPYIIAVGTKLFFNDGGFTLLIWDYVNDADGSHVVELSRKSFLSTRWRHMLRDHISSDAKMIVFQAVFAPHGLYVYNIDTKASVTVDLIEEGQELCGFRQGTYDIVTHKSGRFQIRSATANWSIVTTEFDNGTDFDTSNDSVRLFENVLVHAYRETTVISGYGDLPPMRWKSGNEHVVSIENGVLTTFSGASFSPTFILRDYKLTLGEFFTGATRQRQLETVTAVARRKRGVAAAAEMDQSEITTRLALTALFGADYPEDYAYELSGFLTARMDPPIAINFHRTVRRVYLPSDVPDEYKSAQYGKPLGFTSYRLVGQVTSYFMYKTGVLLVLHRRRGYKDYKRPLQISKYVYPESVRGEIIHRIHAVVDDVVFAQATTTLGTAEITEDTVGKILVIWNLGENTVTRIGGVDSRRNVKVSADGKFVAFEKGKVNIIVYDVDAAKLHTVPYSELGLVLGFRPKTNELLFYKQPLKNTDDVPVYMVSPKSEWRGNGVYLSGLIPGMHDFHFANDFIFMTKEDSELDSELTITTYATENVPTFDVKLSPTTQIFGVRHNTLITIAKTYRMKNPNGTLYEFHEYPIASLEETKSTEEWTTGVARRKRGATAEVDQNEITTRLALTALFGADYPTDYESELGGFLTARMAPPIDVGAYRSFEKFRVYADEDYYDSDYSVITKGGVSIVYGLSGNSLLVMERRTLYDPCPPALVTHKYQPKDAEILFKIWKVVEDVVFAHARGSEDTDDEDEDADTNGSILVIWRLGKEGSATHVHGVDSARDLVVSEDGKFVAYGGDEAGSAVQVYDVSSAKWHRLRYSAKYTVHGFRPKTNELLFGPIPPDEADHEDDYDLPVYMVGPDANWSGHGRLLTGLFPGLQSMVLSEHFIFLQNSDVNSVVSITTYTAGFPILYVRLADFNRSVTFRDGSVHKDFERIVGVDGDTLMTACNIRMHEEYYESERREYTIMPPDVVASTEEWVTGATRRKRGVEMDQSEITTRLALTALFGSDYPHDYENELSGFLNARVMPPVDTSAYRSFEKSQTDDEDLTMPFKIVRRKDGWQSHYQLLDNAIFVNGDNTSVDSKTANLLTYKYQPVEEEEFLFRIWSVVDDLVFAHATLEDSPNDDDDDWGDILVILKLNTDQPTTTLHRITGVDSRNGIVVSTDGKFVALGSSDTARVRVYDVANGQWHYIRYSDGHSVLGFRPKTNELLYATWEKAHDDVPVYMVGPATNWNGHGRFISDLFPGLNSMILSEHYIFLQREDVGGKMTIASYTPGLPTFGVRLFNPNRKYTLSSGYTADDFERIVDVHGDTLITQCNVRVYEKHYTYERREYKIMPPDILASTEEWMTGATRRANTGLAASPTIQLKTVNGHIKGTLTLTAPTISGADYALSPDDPKWNEHIRFPQTVNPMWITGGRPPRSDVAERFRRSHIWMLRGQRVPVWIFPFLKDCTNAFTLGYFMNALEHTCRWFGFQSVDDWVAHWETPRGFEVLAQVIGFDDWQRPYLYDKEKMSSNRMVIYDEFSMVRRKPHSKTRAGDCEDFTAGLQKAFEAILNIPFTASKGLSTLRSIAEGYCFSVMDTSIYNKSTRLPESPLNDDLEDVALHMYGVLQPWAMLHAMLTAGKSLNHAAQLPESQVKRTTRWPKLSLESTEMCVANWDIVDTATGRFSEEVQKMGYGATMGKLRMHTPGYVLRRAQFYRMNICMYSPQLSALTGGTHSWLLMSRSSPTDEWQYGAPMIDVMQYTDQSQIMLEGVGKLSERDLKMIDYVQERIPAPFPMVMPNELTPVEYTQTPELSTVMLFTRVWEWSDSDQRNFEAAIAGKYKQLHARQIIRMQKGLSVYVFQLYRL